MIYQNHPCTFNKYKERIVSVSRNTNSMKLMQTDRDHHSRDILVHLRVLNTIKHHRSKRSPTIELQHLFSMELTN